MKIQVNGLQFSTGFNGILGPKGVGKSRLLQEMAKQELGGTSSTCTKVCSLSQELETFADYTVCEFLRYTAEQEDGQQDAANDLVEKMIDKLQLSRYANQSLSDLSNVAKVQTLLAKALLDDPKFLLLDDILAGLEEQERMYIGYLLSENAKDRVIVLAGTFSQSVEGLFDTVCLLHPEKEAVHVSVHTAYEWVEGKVWEYVADEMPCERAGHIVADVKQADDAVYVREIAAQTPCCDEVSQVTPTLTDAYLWWAEQHA